MKKLLRLWILSILLLCNNLSPAQTLVNRDWVTTGGTPNGIYDIQASHVDAAHNIIVVGNTFHAGQNENFLISKYNSSGTLIFRKEYDGTASNTDFATDVTTIGNAIYVTGVEGDTSTGASYITTIKLDSVGNIIWTAKYQNSYKKYNLGFRIVPDATGGYVFVCGTSQTAPTDFALTLLKYSVSGTQVFVTSYDSVGLYDAGIDLNVRTSDILVYGISGLSSTSGDLITRSYDLGSGSLLGQSRIRNTGAYVTRPVAIAKDNAENIYLTGISSDAGRMDDIVIIKLDSMLNVKWRKYIDGGNSKNDGVSAIKIDSRNNIILTGWAANSDTSKAIWTLKMADSVIVWQKKRLCPISGKDAKGLDVDLDPSNNIYVTGKVYNGVNYDNITVAYDTSGNTRWEQQYILSLSTDDEGRNIKVDSGGNIYVYGRSSTNGSSYTYTTLHYVQDKATFPSDSAKPMQQWAYYTNNGQVIDTGTHQASYISYYTNTNNPRVYLTKAALSYVFSKVDTSRDTLKRVDLVFQTSKGGHAPNTSLALYGSEKIISYLNYYIGGLPQSYEGVNGYQRVTAKSLYPNIDWQLYSDSAGLRYYYVVNPGGTVSDIQFVYSGADSTRYDTAGLKIYARLATVKQLPFTAWQYSGSTPTQISLTCNSLGSNAYKFSVGSYNSTLPLYIRMNQQPFPTLSRSSDNLNWSMYLGGSGIDAGTAIDIDNDGNQFVAGNSGSPQFPTANGQSIIGSFHTGSFVTRFNIDNSLAWSSFYGGTAQPSLTALHNTSSISVGNLSDIPDLPLYIGGTTAYTNLQLPNWSTLTSPYHISTNPGGYADMFIARFDGRTGSLNHATLIGSSAYDELNVLKVDRSNNFLYAGGGTEMTDFPYTNGTYSGNFYDPNGKGIIMQFDNNFAMKWATGIGSTNLLVPGDDIGHGCSVEDLTFDASHNLVAVGQSIFAFPSASPYNITPPSGAYTQGHLASLTYTSTPYNGFLIKLNQHSPSSPNQFDLFDFSEFGGVSENIALCVTTDIANNIYIGGPMYSPVTQFPFLNPGSGSYFLNSFVGTESRDAYLAMFDANGVQKWTTLIGDGTYINSLSVDNNKTLYCFGQTGNLSSGLPLLSKTGYFYDNTIATINKCFIASFTNSHAKDWVTFFGGNGSGETPGKSFLYNNSSLFICGQTTTSQTASDPFPLKYVAPQYNQSYGGTFDAFIANFSVSSTPTEIQNIDDVNSDIKLFPNPTQGEFQIQINESINVAELKVYNCLGQIVFSKSVEGSPINIKLQGLSNGVYFAEIVNSKAKYCSKFIISK